MRALLVIDADGESDIKQAFVAITCRWWSSGGRFAAVLKHE
jgi:hypothetical protein